MKKTSSIIHSIVGRRILGLFMACALLPICVLAFLTLRQVSVKFQEESQQRLKQTSKNVAMSILEGLSFLRTEMENIGENVRNSPRPGAGEHNDLHSRRIKAVSLLRADGTVEILFGALPVIHQMTDTQQQHLAAGKACLFSTTYAAGPPRLFMAIATDRKRPARGVLIGEINTAFLWELVDNSLMYKTAVTILNPLRVPLYSSQPLPRETLDRAIKKLPHSFSGHFEFDSEAGTQLASSWSVILKAEYFFDEWTVVVSTPKNEAFGTVTTFTWTFVLVLLFTLLIAYFFSSVQIRRILVPLTRLREGAGNVGKGEFSRRVEITSGDEFEEMGRSFNSMADRLAGHFKTLEGTSNVVRSILIAADEEKIVATVLDNLHTVIDCHLIGLSLLDEDETGTARTYLSGRPGEPCEQGIQYQTVFRQEELLRLQNEPELLSIESDRYFTGLLSPMKSQGSMTFNLLPFFVEGRLAGVLVLGNLSLWGQDHEGLFRARTIADQIAVAIAKARLMKEHEQLNWGTLHALARTVDTKSKWTAGHSERVAALAQDIGRLLGLSGKELDQLHRAGLLHDIGKIGVSEKLLDKNSGLTEAEFALIREHPAKGVLILEPINAFAELLPLIAEHHERFNGEGYPRGLTGEAISFGARILAVADVYDALVSERPYRQGWELHRVLSYIEKQAGAMFDPVVVQTFLTLHPDHVRQADQASPCFEPGAAEPVFSEKW